MPSWLVDDPTNVYLLLGFALLGCAAAWWVTRKRRFAMGSGAVILLMGLVWLLDYLVVTPREQVLDSIEQMGAAVRRRDADGIFRHISQSFTLGSGTTREGFRQVVERALRDREVEEM